MICGGSTASHNVLAIFSMDSSSLLTRQEILQALRQQLEPIPYVHAMWEAGAIAFDRVDQWSDIDLQFDVDDDHIEEAFTEVEGALASLSPIEIRFRLPDPTWHGHSQAFYRLANASPFLMIDLSISRHSQTAAREAFLRQEIHGVPVVHFDKSGVVKAAPFDAEAHQQTLLARLPQMRQNFILFQPLVLKELNRGNMIEAIAFYHSWLVRPLVELLRIKYCPQRYNFHTRYIQHDLPADIGARLERFFYVANADEIRQRREEGEQWFLEMVADIGKNG